MRIFAPILFSLLYALLNVTGAALIKSALNKQQLNSFSDYLQLLLNFKVIGGFALIFVSALVLFKALSLANFSFVIPVANGINFTLTVLIGYLVFSDKLSVGTLIGLAVIIAGIVIVSVSTQSTNG